MNFLTLAGDLRAVLCRSPQVPRFPWAGPALASPAMSRPSVLLAACGFALTCPACAPAPHEPDAASVRSAVSAASDLALVAIASAPRVLPGGALPVSVQVTNTGLDSWSAGSVALWFLGDLAFTGGALTTTASAAPGDTVTFAGSLYAPSKTGRFTLSFRAAGGGVSFGPTITTSVEVSCGDGVFCNGAELFVNGACRSGAAPCDDGEACTLDVCTEADGGRCHHDASTDCNQCFAPNCTPHCFKNVCGDDGCGGSCGQCPIGLACIDGGCQSVSSAGSCGNAILLAAPDALPGTHTVTGDTSAGVNEVVPSCNATSASPELVYTFTTPDFSIGLDARSEGFDTVLHLRKASCQDPSSTVACADDSSPPGNYGSRVAAMLAANTTYYLIVDGYDATSYGPFTLSATFVRGCVPACDGKYCGDDGCGGSCGGCGDGTFCASNARCMPSPCVPSCNGKKCGDDGCGGSCGSCKDGQLCVTATGACKAFTVCDHDQPTCKTACSSQEYCGTDCECHRARDPRPDLVIDEARLADEILFDTLEVNPASCAVAEACVNGTGLRRLLRFSVQAVNQGQADLRVPPPSNRPDLFDYSECHGHYHFQGFARYELLDAAGNVVLTGRKQAYCMEDTERVADGPGVACDKKYDCSNQGIQAGWSDIYGNALDCQWLDITELPAGDYALRVSVNPSRTFEEVSYDNNTATVPVTIPAP